MSAQAIAEGKVNYVPKANYSGIDTFTYIIEDADGTVLYEADPVVACVPCVLNDRRWSKPSVSGEEDPLANLPKQAEQTLEPRLVYQMDSILKDVILRGTGVRAKALGRSDIAGKTGTSEYRPDRNTPFTRTASFIGFAPAPVTEAVAAPERISSTGAMTTSAM